MNKLVILREWPKEAKNIIKAEMSNYLRFNETPGDITWEGYYEAEDKSPLHQHFCSFARGVVVAMGRSFRQ